MRKKYDVDEILHVGEELMRTQGYNNTGINDILKQSGIPKGSFYNFFESKEAFGKRILEHYGNRMQAVINSVLEDRSILPLERLKRFYRMMIQENIQEACKNGCLVNNISLEVGGLSDPLAKTADAQFNKWVKSLTKCIAEGQEKGEIIHRYPAEELAHYLHGNFYGALSRSKASRSDAAMELFFKMAFDFISVPTV